MKYGEEGIEDERKLVREEEEEEEEEKEEEEEDGLEVEHLTDR